jgi:hypothetical protein
MSLFELSGIDQDASLSRNTFAPKRPLVRKKAAFGKAAFLRVK